MADRNYFKMQGRDERGRFTTSVEKVFEEDGKDWTKWTLFDQMSWNWIYLSMSKSTPLCNMQYYVKGKFMPGLAKNAYRAELDIIANARDKLIELSFDYLRENGLCKK